MFAKFRRWLPLKFYPKHRFEYVYRDGKRIGPFVWSTAWTNLDDWEQQIIYSKRDEWSSRMKKSAHNKSYEPPENPVHFVRDVITYLQHEVDKRDDQIKEKNRKIAEVSKELTAYKRGDMEAAKLQKRIEQLEQELEEARTTGWD